MADFTPRTTQPSTSSEYYTVSSSTSGYPSPIETPSILGNCTWYCYCRWYELLGEQVDKLKSLGNASTWLANAKANGLDTGTTPALGAILCMSGGNFSGLGHVAVVEYIDENYNIKCSQSAYNTGYFYYGGGATKKATSQYQTISCQPYYYYANSYEPGRAWGYDFQGFIYLPGEPIPPTPDPPSGKSSKMNFIFYLPNWNNRRKLKLSHN